MRASGPAALLLGVAVALGAGDARAGPGGVAAAGPPRLEDALPPSPTFSERVAEIRRRVQEAVIYPELARRRGVEGVARVRFAVSEGGRAHDVETVESSGSDLLDRAAEQGARNARDLPYVYGRVEVPVRFELVDRR